MMDNTFELIASDGVLLCFVVPSMAYKKIADLHTIVNRIVLYFIPPKAQENPETLRRYKLVVYGIILTSLFVLYYDATSLLVSYREGVIVLSLYLLYNPLILILIRQKLQLLIATNLFVFGGVIAVFVSLYYSGGFNSSTLPMMAAPPFVALLLAGRWSGFCWLVFNTSCIIVLGIMNKNNYQFPNHYDLQWNNFFNLNNYIGVVLLIFFVGVVLSELPKVIRRINHNALIF